MSFLPPAGVIYSGENFDGEQAMNGADAIAPDESNTLASAVSEINADESAIAAGNDQIDAASVAADGLETLAEKVAIANEGDGIDEAAAEIVEASVECLLRVARIGVPYKSLGIPSSESFRSKANRIALGKATVESLSGTANKIWKSIVDAIKKSIEWVRNFFNKIFGAAERLERRAAALKDSISGLTGKPEETQLENDSLYNAVKLGGSPATASALAPLVKEAKTLFAAQKKITSEYAKLELGEGSGAASIRPTEYGMKVAPGNVAKKVSSDTGSQIFVTSTFPGEVAVYIAFPKDDGAGDAKSMGEFATKLRAGSVSLSEKKDDGKALKTMSLDEIRATAENVEKFAAEVTEYKRGLTEVNSNKDKFIKQLEKHLAKGAGKNEDDTKSDSEKKARAQATIFRKLMDEPAASFASHSIRSMASMLQYAELSARQYEKRD